MSCVGGSQMTLCVLRVCVRVWCVGGGGGGG